MNRAAQRLGRMAKGVKKTITDEERLQRKKRMEWARKCRWPLKIKDNPTMG